ncbi:MAG: hypothetical protein KDA71_16350 [Planctomycetales bacterium]|nr:hypothetical protein [Planctomycetales bacterium]
MTRLLVSVRSAAEARAALAGGVDLIDVKEPNAGALGAATPDVWREVLRAVDRRRPISVALGELLEPDAMMLAAEAAALSAESLGSNDAGVAFAKVGLAGCRRADDWPDRWQRLVGALGDSIAPVAVFYADAENADSPDLGSVCEQASRLGCRMLLIDTFDKAVGPLTELVSASELSRWVSLARRHGLRAVIGGSLRAEDFAAVLDSEPDYVAVRGAACDGSRVGPVSSERVRRLKSRLMELAARTADDSPQFA